VTLSFAACRAFSSDASVIYEATRALPLVAAVQLPAALAYIYDGIFLGTFPKLCLPKPLTLNPGLRLRRNICLTRARL